MLRLKIVQAHYSCDVMCSVEVLLNPKMAMVSHLLLLVEDLILLSMMTRCLSGLLTHRSPDLRTCFLEALPEARLASTLSNSQWERLVMRVMYACGKQRENRQGRMLSRLYGQQPYPISRLYLGL